MDVERSGAGSDGTPPVGAQFTGGYRNGHVLGAPPGAVQAGFHQHAANGGGSYASISRGFVHAFIPVGPATSMRIKVSRPRRA